MAQSLEARGLSVVKAKLSRAAEHKYAFDQQFDAWLEDHPYGYSFDLDRETGWWWFKWHVRKELPAIELGLIFGDMLNNLRGTLDYLAFELVLANNEIPDDNTGFPVIGNRKDWASVLGSQLRGVAPRWTREIESLQPYHRTDRPELHPLAVLNHVNNINKHRTLPAVALYLGEFSPVFEGDLGGRTVQFEFRPFEPVENGAIFHGVRFDPVPDSLDVDMHQDPAIGISFRDGLPHEQGFPDLLDWVNTVIGNFEPAFLS